MEKIIMLIGIINIIYGFIYIDWITVPNIIVGFGCMFIGNLIAKTVAL